jgi:hypothetical protein
MGGKKQFFQLGNFLEFWKFLGSTSRLNLRNFGKIRQIFYITKIEKTEPCLKGSLFVFRGGKKNTLDRNLEK